MKVPCLQIFIRWSKYNLLMLNMVLHTLLIYLTMHSEGSTVCAHAGKYAYHFRHIVEMFWAPMHGAQVPKVWALQNGWKPSILWHSSRKTDSRLRSGCTKKGYIIIAMIKYVTKYSIVICLTIEYSIPLMHFVSCWIYPGCTESIWRDCKWQKSDPSIIQSFITVLVLFTMVQIKFISNT